MAATGCTNLESITLNEGYGQATAYAEIICASHTLAMGDSVTIHMGITGDEADMLIGVVKMIQIRRPEQNYQITVHDLLIRAVDYFMASDNPEAPFLATNISAEALVGQLLALAGLTSYTSEATGFTFGVVTPVKINLVTVWDYIDNICSITRFVCYMDSAGTVHFVSRRPYLVGGDTPVFTFITGDSGSLLTVDYQKDDEKLRNKVVVYGAPGIYAVASASSPYVLPGFLKAMVVAHELIDTNSEAQRTADINLVYFNRLTESFTVKSLGATALRARICVRTTETFTGMAAQDWIIYHARHIINRSEGYSCELTLVR